MATGTPKSPGTRLVSTDPVGYLVLMPVGGGRQTRLPLDEDDLVSVAGYPNPLINSQRDDYSGYRTETGNGGGAFWDDRLNGGAGGWVPVNDPRLQRNPRVVRLGIEMGL